MKRFEAAHVNRGSATQGFDTFTAAGRLSRKILLNFAEFEREMISERMKDTSWRAQKGVEWRTTALWIHVPGEAAGH